MVGFDDIDKRFQPPKPKQGPIVLECRNCNCGDSTVVLRVPKWYNNNKAIALCNTCYNNREIPNGMRVFPRFWC